MLEISHTGSEMATPDAELVARCSAGNSDAFGMLMSRHEAALRRKVRGFALGQPLAEDAEQEIWLRAYQRLGDLRNGASFKSWLMQIASTTCLGVIRRQKQREELAPTVEADIENLDVAANGGRDLVADLSIVTGLLVGLPPKHSEILMLRYLDQLSLQEIAAQSGVSLSGVKWRLRRAKQAFMEAMGDMSGQSKEQAATELLHRAQEAAQASRWEEAIQTYETAARKADLDWNSLQTLGRMYERRGDFRPAIKMLARAIRLNAWHWLFVVIGWCHDGLGDRDRAVATYEGILRSGEAGPWAASAALAGMKAPHPRRRSEPEPAGKERLVPRQGWSVKTNHNPDDAHLAVDGDLTTRWTSAAPQDYNMYFELDLGRAWPVTRVVFDDDGGGQCIWLADCPHGYVIEASSDRADWQKVGEGRANADQYAGAVLDGSPVRYIRARLTDRFFPNWWGIYEIRVYAR